MRILRDKSLKLKNIFLDKLQLSQLNFYYLNINSMLTHSKIRDIDTIVCKERFDLTID